MVLLSIGDLRKLTPKEQKSYVLYRQEVDLIKKYIQSVFGQFLKMKGEDNLRLALKSIKHGNEPESMDNRESCSFPTLVETIIFQTAVKEQEKNGKVLFTRSWADQPRIMFFRVAWGEIGLPAYPISEFHLDYGFKKYD